MNLFFFFNDTATTEIYTLSLHDALPIFAELFGGDRGDADRDRAVAVIRDPFVGGGVFETRWQFHRDSSRHVRPARSMPPLSVCLRNWRSESLRVFLRRGRQGLLSRAPRSARGPFA